MESNIILYTSHDGNVRVDVVFSNETFWMSQRRIAELFGVQRPAITKHLRNIFLTGELNETAVSSKMEHTADDGKTYGDFDKEVQRLKGGGQKPE